MIRRSVFVHALTLAEWSSVQQARKSDESTVLRSENRSDFSLMPRFRDVL